MQKNLKELEVLFLALADQTRLRILNLMGEDEISVSYLVEVLNESQPKISRHLAYLRSAGLVTVRRDGKWMHYRIVEPQNAAGAEILGDLLDWLGSQDQMKKERRRLEEIGGVTRKIAKPRKEVVAKKPARSREDMAVETYYEIEPTSEEPRYEEEIISQQEERAAPPPFVREELETFLL